MTELNKITKLKYILSSKINSREAKILEVSGWVWAAAMLAIVIG